MMKNISNILKNIAVKCVKDKLENVPDCHLDVIINRFIRSRLFFWGNLDNGRLQTEQEKLIDSESFASKSQRAHILTTKKSR